MIASKKMKQLQWEKVSKAQLSKTVWGETAQTEDELMGKMQAVNLWSEMEDEFKAKEIIRDAVSESTIRVGLTIQSGRRNMNCNRCWVRNIGNV